MQQHDEFEQFEQVAKPPASNPTAIVGLVLAFCVSPLGLLVSIFAALKQPRGLAIAGIVIGLLGTIVWGVGGSVLYAGYKRFGRPMVETGMDIAAISQKVGEYQSKNGSVPPDLATASVTGDALVDAWGNGYEYEAGADGKSWTLTILGPDKTKGTTDDGVVRSGMSQGEIRNALEATFKASVEQQIAKEKGGALGSGQPAPSGSPESKAPAAGGDGAPPKATEEKQPAPAGSNEGL